MVKIGIYTITNIVNNKIYVGSTRVSFNKREYKHFNDLEKGRHGNSYLQSSYNKYGKDNFKFEILEEYPKEDCLGMERYWINILNTTNKDFGYNLIWWTGGEHTYTTQTEKHRQDRIIRAKKVHIGRKRSKETCNKISESLKGHKPTQEVIDRQTESRRYFYNNFKNKLMQPVLQYDLSGNFIQEFDSVRTAVRFLKKINPSAASSPISKCCHKRPSFKSAYKFIWKFKERKELEIGCK